MAEGLPGLVGAYELLEPLGRGGMGEVYRARDTRLGRLVAIKFLSTDLQDSPAAAARLDREARLASSLNHPGIVTVFDIGRVEGRPYVVMELIVGQSLAKRLADGPMELPEAVDVAAQVAEALAAAHAGGVVHRDLKPQNIMLTNEGRAKVVDFGLSKLTVVPADADEVTKAGNVMTAPHAVLGTAGYMAPEQVAGVAVDARSDQFALGAILYEMLTGRRAFRRETSVQTLAAILEDEPPHVSTLRHDTPPALAAIVGRCLAKRPDDRYAATRLLARELREARETLAMESRSKQSGRRATQRTARHRFWGLLALVLLAAIGALIWSKRDVAPAVADPRAAGILQIAVLPFVNVSRGAEDQVFAEGLVETLTSSLTQLERFQPSLRVVPTSEIRAGRVTGAREALEAFGATLVVTGSVQRSESTLRLTLNLVDAAQQVQRASRTVDVAAGTTTAVQDLVVGTVSALLALELEPTQRQAMTAGGSRTPGAFEAFVQGRGYLQRFDRGAESVERAIEALNRAIAADPRYALAHASLCEGYWRRYELDRQAHLIEQAVDHCEQALAIDSRLAPVHTTLALVARGRGRYEEAVAVAQRAIELDPTSSDAYRELARAFEALDRRADAEATYQKAVAARPDDWLAYNNLGSFFYARGRLPEALSAFGRVTELTPDNTRGHNNLGATLHRMGRTEEATRVWERSIAIRPTFAATSNLGTAYFRDGRYTEAARAFERACELTPNDYRVWRNLGAALYWAPGERGKAATAFSRAVKLGEEERKVNPRQPALLAQLADAYSMLGDRQSALAAAVAVERLGTSDPDAAFNVANAYEQLGERDRALRWLEQALATGYSRDAVERSPSLAELRKDPRFNRPTRRR
jgi:tetratricopeptide (TPR) repeat protein/tRNA A-37 threonylcarbamoyl transferase component Bud32